MFRGLRGWARLGDSGLWRGPQHAFRLRDCGSRAQGQVCPVIHSNPSWFQRSEMPEARPRTVGGVEASDAARCCQDLDFVNPKPSGPNAGNEAGT